METILKYALIICGSGIGLYIMSRIQMKAWIDEIDLKLGNSLKQFINYNKKKQENDSTEKK